MNAPDTTVAPQAPQAFRLQEWQVPEPPESDAWLCHLRWMVTVMDPSDRSFHFVASCLAHCAKSGGLTDKQARAIQKCEDRIMQAYKAEILECQL